MLLFNSSFIALLQASGIIHSYNSILLSNNASAYDDAALLYQIPKPAQFGNMPSRLTASGFHPGEVSMHEALRVPSRDFATPEGLPPSFGMRVVRSPMVAVGTLDDRGRPWTSVWGGERGFAKPVAENVLGMDAVVEAGDPVFQQLWKGGNPLLPKDQSENGSSSSSVVNPNSGMGKVMSALSIDLETRDRVKIMGRMVLGTADKMGEGDRASVRMAMVVEESLGNCPKYLNKKEIVPNQEIASPLAGDGKARSEDVADGEGLPLGTESLALIARADLLFMSSEYNEKMDTNIRGGAPGFVRVIRNDEGGVELVYPEYSGNRLYQTLGNIKMNPLVGLVIPDLNTSDVLYLTGSASILIGEPASSMLPRTKLAVKITITAARFTKNGLSFRGRFIDYSPYNPPVRHLYSERDAHVSSASQGSKITAHLTRREQLTPDIIRCTFRLETDQDRLQTLTWHAGQYLTFDFASELDNGYSHMKDDDPQSLNDDFVRTFTISSPPPDPGREGTTLKQDAQITIRIQGAASRFLSKHNEKVPLEIPVLGIGGEEAFRMPTTRGGAQGKDVVYIAAGVGITPLLAQAPGLLRGDVDFVLLWSLRAQDIPLAIDSFQLIPGLAKATTVFLTGGAGATEETVAELKEQGVAIVERRRMAETDLERFTKKGTKFYLCTGPSMLEVVRRWLEAEEVAWEDFGY